MGGAGNVIIATELERKGRAWGEKWGVHWVWGGFVRAT